MTTSMAADEALDSSNESISVTQPDRQSGFRTDLQVRRTVDNQAWILTQPLIWEGDWETLYIKPGFRTDFASVPKPMRWLLDTGGKNAAAGVLHDVAWRESKRSADVRRVDPWHADGLFRRALRYAKVAPVPRNMLWVGVRVAATLSGRIGRGGPSMGMKILKTLMWAVLALLIIGVPLAAVLLGYVLYLVVGLLATPIALAYKARRQAAGDEYDPQQVFPRLVAPTLEQPAPNGPIFGLLVIPTKDDDEGLVEADEELHLLLTTYLRDIKEQPDAHWQDLASAQKLQAATQQ